jgi:hypothetical protein
MEAEEFLSQADAERTRRTLTTLSRFDFSRLVLTGGFAVELHHLLRGLVTRPRPLNDIDFLAGSFAEIPEALSSKMQFRHVHPMDPPGRMLMQCVDPETAVRVDIFYACGDTMQRATPIEIGGIGLRLIAMEDLTARTARLCMDLVDSTPAPAKHARDFLRLHPLADLDAVESVWQEHRKPKHPKSFKAAAGILTGLIASLPDLQIIPRYSTDANDRCSRCEVSTAFPLADPEHVLRLLGYC